MLVDLLGPVTARTDDAAPSGVMAGTAPDAGTTAVPVSGARLRMLLARLALAAGRPVSADALIDGLWGEELPTGAEGALHALVSRLRKALQGVGTVELGAGGYSLSVKPADVDAHRFEQLLAQGRRELAAGNPERAAPLLREALGLWRGAALADVLDAPFAQPYAARYDELRSTAAADLYDAEIRLGRHAEILVDLAAAAAGQPLNERLAELHMRALSASGRQSDALAVYEQLRRTLADWLGVDPSAELRDIHLALLRGELDRPAAQPAIPAPSRLPAQLTSFVGREAELGRLAELTAAARLVTIVGPPGAGKTRLSLEAVARHDGYQRGLAWFVPLAGLGPSAAGQLADAVLGALGSADRGIYAGGQSPAAPADRIAELLDVGDALLILDNCEHLVAAAAELADQLLDRLPRLRILATSREPLAITGEALLHLGPLPLPGHGRGRDRGPSEARLEPDLAEAAESAAVQLFVDRAAGVRPGFVLDVSTLDAVVEIVWQLDGMPLALELAAARLRSMSVDQIARRLDDRFRLLTSGSRVALPRHRTLLAVVEWSWDLLDEREHVLARRLSVFPGGATLAALEGVCAAPPLADDDVLYVIGSLVEKSLVEVVEPAEAGGGTVEGEPRYRMLETVRAYAAAQLERSGEDVALPCFRQYFLELAEQWAPLLRTRDQLRAMTVFDAEHDNLLHALRLTLDVGDAAAATRFIKAMFWYWGNRGLRAQLESFMTELLNSGDALPESARAAFRLAGYGEAQAAEIHPARLLWVSQQVFSADVAELGEGRFQDALASPDPWVRASAHWARNFLLVEQGDLRTGADAAREALRGFEEVGDRWGLVMSLLAVGRLPSLEGRFAESITAFERAVAISYELGTEDYVFWTGTRLARERMRSGDLDGAGHDLEALRRRAQERGQRRREASLVWSFANLHRRAGDVAASERVLAEMGPLVHKLPYPEQMAKDLIDGTRLMNRLMERRPAEARELLPRAVRPNFARGQSNGLAWAAEQVAELHALEGDAPGAATMLGMSEAIRGAFDAGEPILRTLVADLVGGLGEDGYQAAYGKGAALARPDALSRLAGLAGQPDSAG